MKTALFFLLLGPLCPLGFLCSYGHVHLHRSRVGARYRSGRLPLRYGIRDDVLSVIARHQSWCVQLFSIFTDGCRATVVDRRRDRTRGERHVQRELNQPSGDSRPGARRLH